MHNYLDFEKPVAELEGKIHELRLLAREDPSVGIAEEVSKLEAKADQLLKNTYASLDPWQKTQVARHPDRPHFCDYLAALLEDFSILSGDRNYAEDQAIIGGVGWFRGCPVVAIGHEKGNDTGSRMRHNFGMARPEGYRKAVRLMDLAERFDMPVLSFVDTAGAYPGVGAEERGQAEAIARSIDRCLSLPVPMVTLLIGEGGSGGALAIAASNTIMMLEHAIYTVASPEASASILWRSADKAREAATAMKITAQDLHAFGVIDRILPEPVGGAHRAPDVMIQEAGDAMDEALHRWNGLSAREIRQARQEKFMAMGRTLDASPSSRK